MILHYLITAISNYSYQQETNYMSKILRPFKLPASLSNNKIITTINGYMSMLGPHSSYVTYLLYKKNSKYHFIYKDTDFPFLPFDWTTFLIMRCHAKSILTTGLTMRTEHWVYGEQVGTFGKEELQNIYKDNVLEPINLFVYSKQMNDEAIKNAINKKYFNYIPLDEIAPPGSSIKQITEKLN